MSISGVNQYESNDRNLSSMNRIQSASNDPSGLSISEKLKSQSGGLSVAGDNAKAGKDLLNTAEGSLGTISDSLQRIRELSVKASNGIYGAEERIAIQKEVEQLKSSIQSVAKNTQFNKMELLDGSKADLHLASNPDGTGMKIQLVNATLEALGIADYDVTGEFDISDIDDAISMISKSRSEIGASTNALESAISANSNTELNLVGANSRLEDLDVAKAISDMKKEQVLEQYQFFVRNTRDVQEKSILRLFENI